MLHLCNRLGYLLLSATYLLDFHITGCSFDEQLKLLTLYFMSQGLGKLTECDFSSTFPGFQTSSAPANRKNKIRYNQNNEKTNRPLEHLF